MKDWLGDNAGTPAWGAWNAVCEASYARLEQLLETHGKTATAEVQSTMGHPVTALAAAARNGDTRAMARLLEAGADPNVRACGNTPQSPMAWSIEADSLGCVRMLIATDAVKQPEREDWADMAVRRHDYAARPDPAILRTLLEARAPATAHALGRAIEDGKYQVARLLLNYGADANESDARTGLRPIANAIRLVGRREDLSTIGPRMMKLLLECGASPNTACGGEGYYQPAALIAAVEHGKPWAVQVLLASGADAARARTHIREHGVRSNETCTNCATDVVEALAMLM